MIVLEKKAFKLEAKKKSKRASSTSTSPKKERRAKQVEKESKKDIPVKETPSTTPEKPKKLTKKRLANMTPEQAAEVTAAAVEARRQARIEKRIQRKIEQEELSRLLAGPRDVSGDGWVASEAEFTCENGWIVVLTPEGNVYQEPVSRYCDLSSFLAVVCSLPCISADSHLRMEAAISRSVFEYGEIVAAAYLGMSTRNNFAEHFNIQTEPRIVGGNIVFSGKDNTSFTLEQAREVTKWVIAQLEAEEEVDTSD